LQRYKCQKCGLQFQSKEHPSRRRKILWNQYIWGKQTLKQLSITFKKCIPVIQKDLDAYVLEKNEVDPQRLVLLADVTFFGRGYGILAFRSQLLKQNIYWKEINQETPAIYREARKELESKGFAITGIVLDGRRGVREVFSDIPVQMCQFHQTAILKRYLTSRPKTEAGQELRAIGLALKFLNEKDFLILLEDWHKKWKDFIKEKTTASDGKHWSYTHRRMRSAYRSLKTNSPFLFTYQKYPELNMPNTTNSLDGFFGKTKTLLQVHRGLTQERRYKIIQEIFKK
jgi:hypothetical protein